MARRINIDEKRAKVAAIQAKVKEGLGPVEASAAVGISDKSYYNYRQSIKIFDALALKKENPKFIDLQTEPAAKKVAVIFCDIEDVQRLFK